MNDFKNKIENYINSNKSRIIGTSALKNNSVELFFNIQTIDKKIEDYKHIPAEFFENFDYSIYDKDYFFDNTDYSKFIKNIPEKSNLIVMLNGYFSKENSKIISKNITVMSMIEKVKNEFFGVEKFFSDYSELYENQFTVLNSILAKDGIFLHIHPNSTVEEPIYFINVITKQTQNFLFNYRKLIVADENSSAKIIEKDLIFSDYKSLILNVFLMRQAKNSQLNYSRIRSKTNANHSNSANVSFIVCNKFKLDANAKLNFNTVNFDRNFGRDKTHFLLEGENAEANVAMFCYLRNAETIDVSTVTTHLAPNTFSNQLVKNIADDDSTFSFDGKIFVSPDAQKIKASQNSRAILLSDNAQVNCQPQLEIYADDVSCSHGSAIGNLDEELIFYLNSRGIGKESAKKLLLSAFAAEVLNKIPDNDILIPI